MFNHWYNVSLERYLSDPQLSWETYFNENALEAEYGTRSIPENKERMLVQGGILMSLYQMHGKDGLKNIFSEIELIKGDDEGLSTQQRNENFINAVGDGLKIDVTDYFEYWKYPISSETREYLSHYPKSEMINDSDGDGFSPLHGDFDDTNDTIYPDAPEIDDGVDNNLDGQIDEHVYVETSNDFISEPIMIPALIQGNISTFNDKDSFSFTINEPKEITITVFSVRGDKNTQEKINTYSGVIYLNDYPIVTLVPDWWMSPNTLVVEELEAGEYTLQVTTDDGDNITPNLGDYEIQIFVNDYNPPDRDYDTLVNNLYPEK